MTKIHKPSGFVLEVHPGRFQSSQITVLLGENGTGKTTFIEMLAKAGKKKKKEGEEEEVKEFDLPEMNISYKPQLIAPKF
jgi:ATP-binding cassette, sub-family E, member 1